MIIHLFLASKRKSRLKSVSYDRNVRIDRGKFLGPSTSQNMVSVPPTAIAVLPPRRSSRISKPVNRINYGLITCFVCKKTFRNDVSMMQNMGPVACSFNCFKKAL